jgi:zeaxanthin epoxidase
MIKTQLLNKKAKGGFTDPRSCPRIVQRRPVQDSSSNGSTFVATIPLRKTPVHEPRQHVCAMATTVDAPNDASTSLSQTNPPLKVVIAGAGIGGLVLALGLLKKGFKVQVLERDLTAIRGEGKYRGPIQVQSNALAALEAIDVDVAERIMAAGCITGDRINGLCDGVTGEWYVKFDTYHPAVDKGLPVTRVISRYTLQDILADACMTIAGENVIINDITVVDYEQIRDPQTGKISSVKAVTEDGRSFEGDMLIGADGIWSKIRNKMIGNSEATYSDYTCYTGISNFTPADIDTVGYRVFLGNGLYFVSSDVGGGKTQWYGFHKEPAGGSDEDGKKKDRLLQLFGHWSDNVTDLIRATPEEDVLRRDIFDRAPVFKWTDGRVALLGDSVHAMQPNLGQGGCMAIEDAFQLVTDLTIEAEKASSDNKSSKDIDVEGILRGYFGKRLVRASAIHGMARFAAIMASTYKAYLGEGLGPLGNVLLPFKIPHPGRVTGQFILKTTMPAVLDWVLGGYKGNLERSGRAPSCRLEDQPVGFAESDFPIFMKDDEALLKAANATWLIVPVSDDGYESGIEGSFDEMDWLSAPIITQNGLFVCTDTHSPTHDNGTTFKFIAKYEASLEEDQPHAELIEKDGEYWIIDMDGQSMLNGKKIVSQQQNGVVSTKLHPNDVISFAGSSKEFKVKMQHSSVLKLSSMDGSVDMYYDRKSRDLVGV